MARLFISSEKLESLTAEGKASLEGARLTLTEFQRTFVIKEAVRFLSLVTDDPDAPGLLGKVKDRTELIELGAEHEGETVLLDDLGYNVQEGFVGTVMP